MVKSKTSYLRSLLRWHVIYCEHSYMKYLNYRLLIAYETVKIMRIMNEPHTFAQRYMLRSQITDKK